jgi:hypothetical protein
MPGSTGSPEDNPFARSAANACLAAPLIICALSFCLSPILQNHRDASGRPLFIIIGLTEVGFSLVGFIFGILAIVLAKPGQRASVTARALCGLALLGLLAAIAVPNFVRARGLALERKQALDQVHTAASELRAQAVASLTNAQARAADAQELKRSLSQAAEKSSGETAVLLKSTAVYVERLQSFQRTYAQAAKDLTAAKVLSASTLQQRAQIQDRKALVQKFLDANAACKNLVLHGESIYSNQLAAAGISAGETQAALTGFRKNLSVQAPLMLDIRQADERMGKAMLGILNLFEDQWGQWSYDANARVVRFEDRSAFGEYNALMTQFKQAGTDQAAASQRLAALMSGSTSSL